MQVVIADDDATTQMILKGLVLLMDIRHPMTEFDQMIVNWAIETEMPLLALLTKADKLKRGPAKSTYLKVRNEFRSRAPWLTVQMFSSLKKDGVPEACEWLNQQLCDTDEALETPAE